jgi:hypothetical protein
LNNLTTKTDAILQTLVTGDLSRLSPEEKLGYYTRTCESLGLNPLTKPFAYIKLNGKETLYATRDCADQLRKIHKVSIKITAREHINGVYVVTAQATMVDGRCDESTGAVATDKLSGEILANAYLKCETKAKRRVTLSICGLGLLDETEVETIRDAVRLPIKTLEDISEERAKELQQALKDDQTKNEMTAIAKDLKERSKPKPAFRIPEGVAVDAADPSEYVMQSGREGGAVKGKKLKDIDEGDLMGYMQFLRRGGKDGASQDYLSKPEVAEDIIMAEDFLNEKKRRKLENGN